MDKTVFYVSLLGDDSFSGAQEQPFATCAKAQIAAREALASGSNFVEIVLSEGVHRISKTLSFDSRDGIGETGNGKVVWRGAGAGKTILSGFIELSPFTEVEPGLWQRSACGLNFRQVYVNFRRASMARFPKSGKYFKVSAWLPDTKEVVINATEFPKNPGDSLEMVVYMAWSEAILKFKSALRTSTEDLDWCSPIRLRFEEPEHSIIFRRKFPIRKPGLPYFWQNCREFLTEPGEWFLDRETDTLYYRPLKGEDIASSCAFVPQTETLVEIRGTPDNPVRNITFEGMTFEGTNWVKPSVSGLLNLQAGMFNQDKTNGNMQYHGRPPAAFYASYAEGLIVENCEFRNTGATALDFHRGVLNSIVQYCEFYNLAGAGINLGVFSEPDMEAHTPYNPADERELTRSITISDNYIHDIGLDYPGTCAIAAGFVRDTILEHNYIHDVPYIGISVGWGWTLKANAMRNNHIRRNKIQRAMTVMLDGAGIYTLSSMPGSTIFENHIFDIRTNPEGIGARSYGIYLDEGSDGITVENNLIQNIECGNNHKLNPSGINVFKFEGKFDNPEVRMNAGPRKK